MDDLGVKKDFPIFRHHPELVFLDNAATTQKPQVVIDAEKEFYETTYANIHRATYAVAVQATRRNLRRRGERMLTWSKPDHSALHFRFPPLVILFVNNPTRSVRRSTPPPLSLRSFCLWPSPRPAPRLRVKRTSS